MLIEQHPQVRSILSVECKNFEEDEMNTYYSFIDAVESGKKLGVPVYKALKEPIIRRFGEEFYKALECAEELLKEQEK